VPFATPEDDLAGTASAMKDESAVIPPVLPFVCEVGLRGGGDSARDESLLSREAESRRLPTEA
jgi:hypothetical protein